MSAQSLPGALRSFWIETSPYPRYPRLVADLEVDVAIIGGGITGLTAAALLARKGKTVAVLEAKRLAEGVTGQTSAHLTEAIDTRFVTLKKDFGKDGAALAARAGRDAIERISRFIDELSIECRFRRVPGFLYSEREDDLEQLHAEYEAAKEVGVAVSMSRDVPLPFATAAGVRFEGQAELHIREYLLPLAREIEASGGRIFEETRVRDIEEGEPCRVRTEDVGGGENGAEVRAKHVIVAANVPLTRFQLQTRLTHYRSYVLGAQVVQPALEGLFWDTSDPYHYLRSDPATGLLIVGGEDHKTGTESHTEQRFEALLAYTRAHFDVKDIGFHWAGQVIETSDGLPFVGRSSRDSNVLVATGYGGNGLTFGTAGAMLLSDVVLGVDNDLAELLAPTRVKPLASAASFVKDNAEVAYHMVADLVRAPDGRDPAEVAPGEGKIITVDGRRLAMYRDEDGTLDCLSAVCPHLGCHVHFNDAEKSWDCPCHGSRFDTKGAVLNGPSTRGLTRVALDEPEA